MAHTKQTARLSTGGTAKQVSLTWPVLPVTAQADVQMLEDMPSSDLQVSTHHYEASIRYNVHYLVLCYVSGWWSHLGV